MNSGTIQNFVINNKTNIVTKFGLGLSVYKNSGILKNGYVFGNDIDATPVMDVLHNEGKAVGGIAGINTGTIQNVYSLVAVNRESSNAIDNNVGNIVGHNTGTLKNMYSAEDDNTEVLYFMDATATFYSFTDEPKVIEF